MVLSPLNRLSSQSTDGKLASRAGKFGGRSFKCTRPSLPDYLAPDLRALFVGINPGLRSAGVGHHYAGHSNRFWKLLYEAKLIPEPITYRDDARLLEWGFGLTNLVGRATASSGSLMSEDYAVGRRNLLRKIRRWHPRVLVLLGLTIYPVLFPREGKSWHGILGLQSVTVHGARVFLLPNPSGRNAFYSYETMLKGFRLLSRYVKHHEAG
jgi:TDG/mug DNA glycosylase family protein